MDDRKASAVKTDDEIVERLLEIAETSAGDLGGEDPERVAVVVLRELLGRAALFEAPATPVTVQFDLGAGRRRLGYRVAMGPGDGRVSAGWDAAPVARVRQDLAELVRATYGSVAGGHHATREVFLAEDPGPSTHEAGADWVLRRRAAVVALHGLTKAAGALRFDLDELAVRTGTDKWGGHWYTPQYGRHFEAYRDRRVKILEIGVGGYNVPTAGGESLRMWKNYFRRGLVYGIDFFDKTALAEPRIRVFRGDQSDPVFLAGVLDEIGTPDIVIDDGSHLCDHVLAAFRVLFPRLATGGLYVIEDLQSSYWPGWNGGRTGLDDPGTTTGFLKGLLDGLHHAEHADPPGRVKADTDDSVTGMHVYHNIAFLEKGINSEQGAPSWIRKDVNPMDQMNAVGE
ncbi:class I SAM-dependent methyltransferase [Amycolatopsis sp. NPDC059021]|uniref:class I SAM-dependent methyltransferase n=1 Tax=Amycolatopsis sp. NPDC059021 TaxID=3346704 RepID=UPI0036719E56